MTYILPLKQIEEQRWEGVRASGCLVVAACWERLPAATRRTLLANPRPSAGGGAESTEHVVGGAAVLSACCWPEETHDRTINKQLRRAFITLSSSSGAMNDEVIVHEHGTPDHRPHHHLPKPLWVLGTYFLDIHTSLYRRWHDDIGMMPPLVLLAPVAIFGICW